MANKRKLHELPHPENKWKPDPNKWDVELLAAFIFMSAVVIMVLVMVGAMVWIANKEPEVDKAAEAAVRSALELELDADLKSALNEMQ